MPEVLKCLYIYIFFIFLRFLESFKNIEPIGEGGFGNVFKATAKLDERTYAVKRVQFTKYVLYIYV